MQEDFSSIQKWRLLLGKAAENPEDKTELSAEANAMDECLGALYNQNDGQAGLGDSSPQLNRWLGDIRKYFPAPLVQIMQKDAFDRLGLEEMLLEPELLESLEPNVELLSTLLSLNKVIPEKTRETARLLVQKVVEELKRKLENPLRQAVKGALNRSVRNRRPRHKEIDWLRTIQLNLKHYQQDYKTVVPERLIGSGKKGQSLKEIILCVDQSGSMGSSLVYSSIFGAVLASLPALRSQMIVFDTEVVDLSAYMQEPVDLLFGTQLGGGTDINKALAYAQKSIRSPQNTTIVLISDLYEGGDSQALLQRVAQLKKTGVQLISLLALNDQGAPIYDRDMAQKFAQLGSPAFACTPQQFPRLIAAALEKKDIHHWLNQEGISPK
ncbi:vWA domain-containing protein [Saprospira grandis]|uniref:VWA containing CoxE family protein n=1 Tax=Saprospira grandis (strain Lewin) TaxID=984262 RepID=H6KZH5_SAPGL|nr:VWA domain-containing protein [Saprospira grandis]AFC25751.1 VWA containing CoxE family protein [Saprospira grandis str. Lewin]